MTEQRFDVKDLALTDQGVSRIEWALQEMPVVRGLMQRFEREQPLQDVRISGCLHITTETANLARVLRAGGADLVLCASNPLSTQDDVALPWSPTTGSRLTPPTVKISRPTITISMQPWTITRN